MRIIGLDTATKTGWSVKGASGVFESILKRGESPGMRFLRFRAWLKELIQSAGGVDLIVYEQAHHRGGAATQLCVGLTTEVLAAAAEVGAQTMPVHTATLKKWATGKGNADKSMMVVRAKELGYLPEDDNEADAILLRHYAISELGINHKADASAGLPGRCDGNTPALTRPPRLSAGHGAYQAGRRQPPNH